jgi:gamma-F420-2:alpha-L-glutamate ligase
MKIIGIGKNDWARGVPEDLVRACEKLEISYRLLDFSSNFESKLSDITHLAPCLFILKPQAVEIYRVAQSRGVVPLNPIASVEVADDKAKTYLTLMSANIPQVPTELIDLNLESLQFFFRVNVVPTIFKMRHGGQGRWVRLICEESQILTVFEEFNQEGIGPILAQPFIEEANGESIRVIVTGGEVVAASVRRATQDWRSNISLGGVQEKYALSTYESDVAIAATKALGLGHAGVDLIKMEEGIKVLEVNACPDFTSMRNISSVDIAEAVITATLKARNP